MNVFFHFKCLFRTASISEVQPFAASLTLSPHSLNLEDLSLHRNRSINNFVHVLILRNLDVLGLLVDVFPFSLMALCWSS